ncbi:HIT family protein [Luteipulveratus sp. YIM 133132]|uniref:HIT family protein n=1 Tax=Luteipulveratus flavus TaxID=3031728 RepID=A0ABT6CA33_9MICO|nr:MULTISPECIES: HIT family protein [unclassified Luteipulveratus]MDE9366125.1 HIT family protein [Luteipulveratus sp. YIM 133132]MDF8265217.1 HIT family protein [Luteipulveratus sp. YIM 133296]
MATLFSKIIDGEIPGHFVWQDEVCVAFLVIDPLTDGHTIVVPRTEVDQWLDADEELVAHLVGVAKQVGLAQRQAWDAPRAGLMVMGFEVPHLHVHVWPTWSMADFDLSRVTHGEDQKVLADNAQRVRDGLRGLGHSSVVPG